VAETDGDREITAIEEKRAGFQCGAFVGDYVITSEFMR
jgi:hypothetical protein